MSVTLIHEQYPIRLLSVTPDEIKTIKYGGNKLEFRGHRLHYNLPKDIIPLNFKYSYSNIVAMSKYNPVIAVTPEGRYILGYKRGRTSN